MQDTFSNVTLSNVKYEIINKISLLVESLGTNSAWASAKKQDHLQDIDLIT